MCYRSGKKKVVEKQDYEKYWKLTLAFTAYFDSNFIRTLSTIVEHIDKYDLKSKTIDEVSTLGKTGKRRIKENVVHTKELVDTINYINPVRDTSGATIRKQINTFIKLGFIKPFYLGYTDSAKKYTENRSEYDLRRLFSDTVYEYSSFNSSQTNDDTNINQIHFIIQTILNRPENNRKINYEELIGLMNMDINNKKYATEKDLDRSIRWTKHNGFINRKYNQISYLESVLRNLAMFEANGYNNEFILYLKNKQYKELNRNESHERDPYRFSLMKDAVYKESMNVYNKKICWLTKRETEGLVVSHLYPSAEALKNLDIDAAYDPNNALLLDPGSPDKYIDKFKMTIKDDGTPVYGPDVMDSFVESSLNNNYRIDDELLNSGRKKYLKVHQNNFIKKYPKLSNMVRP